MMIIREKEDVMKSLTYPLEHELAGQVLHNICVVGLSVAKEFCKLLKNDFDIKVRSYPEMEFELRDIQKMILKDNTDNTILSITITNNPAVVAHYDTWEVFSFNIDDDYSPPEIEVRCFRAANKEVRNVDNYHYYNQYANWNLVMSYIFGLPSAGGEKARKLELEYSSLSLSIDKWKANKEFDLIKKHSKRFSWLHYRVSGNGRKI